MSDVCEETERQIKKSGVTDVTQWSSSNAMIRFLASIYFTQTVWTCGGKKVVLQCRGASRGFLISY